MFAHYNTLKMLLTGLLLSALLFTTACVKPTNPYRNGFLYNGIQTNSQQSGDEHIRVLSNGELHFN